jgi:hypothetical protein
MRDDGTALPQHVALHKYTPYTDNNVVRLLKCTVTIDTVLFIESCTTSRRPMRRANNLATCMCQLYRSSGILNHLEPCPGLYRDCFTFTLPVEAIYRRHKPKIHVYSSQNVRAHVDQSAQLFTKKATE